jgi:hypothetical protein
MSTKDAKRAAKKHAKEKKRQAMLARRPILQVESRTPEERAERARALAEFALNQARSGQARDLELARLLDDVDVARLDPGRRAETFRRLLELDGMLAADGGVERFRAIDAIDDMVRLWLCVSVGTEASDPIEQATAGMLRVLPAISDLDLEVHLWLAVEPLLFRLGRGDEALDRFLLNPKLSYDDLDNATNAVLDSAFATRENVVRVRDACAAWVPSNGDGAMRDTCIDALDAWLANPPVAPSAPA